MSISIKSTNRLKTRTQEEGANCRIAIWNARSVRNKIIELREKAKDYDIIGITETWLSPNDNFRLKGYNTYRKDREGKKGGGLGILVKNDIRVKVREDVTWLKNKTEILAVTVNLDNEDIDIIVIYKQPNQVLKKEEWRKLFKNKRSNTELIVMGDFNANNREWNCYKEDSDGISLGEVVNEEDMFIRNEHTTSRTGSGKYRPSNIDLIITTFGIYQDAEIIEEGETLGSDHQIIGMKISKCLARREGKMFTTRKVKENKINWNIFKMQQLRYEESLKEETEGSSSTEEKCNILTKYIMEAVKGAEIKEGNEGRKEKDERRGEEENKIKHNRSQTNRLVQFPWWDEECIKVKMERKKAVRKFVKNPSSVNWQIYKEKAGEVKELIKNKRNKAWEEMATTINHRTRGTDIWRKVKNIQKGFDNNMSNNNISAEERETLEDIEIGKLIQRNSRSDYRSVRDEEGKKEWNKVKGNEDISENEILTAIETSNSKSAPGEDGVGYIMLKNLIPDYKEMLKDIYKEVWETLEVPEGWKKAVIIFLDKPNKKALRPISLTASMGKIMERIVNNRLIEWAEESNIMDEGQNGFRRGRSTIDNLTILSNDVRRGFESRRDTLTVCLDVKAAYDNVKHDILIRLLKEKKCPDKIIKYVENWLTNREIKCIRKYRDPVTGKQNKGLPQGAILSPILYNIYTSNITDNINRQKVTILQYADDIIMYTTSNAVEVSVKTLEDAVKILIKNLQEIKLDVAEE